ncbi:MAG: hypothetical protein ABI193_25955 [Minicystis sp.]
MALGLAAFGCNPAGPGVAGKISLDAGVDAKAFKTLEVRAAPDFGTSFDPAHPNFVPDTDWTGVGGDLSTLTFPLDYELAKIVGKTEQSHWRVIGWLSQEASGTAGSFPKTGEIFGTQAFDLAKCGLTGGFCGTTAGVDLTLEHEAP